MFPKNAPERERESITGGGGSLLSGLKKTISVMSDVVGKGVLPPFMKKITIALEAIAQGHGVIGRRCWC